MMIIQSRRLTRDWLVQEIAHQTIQVTPVSRIIPACLTAWLCDSGIAWELRESKCSNPCMCAWKRDMTPIRECLFTLNIFA